MGNLGWAEIMMILVIALIVFGPRKLPELGKTLGQSLAQFRRASEDFKRQWEDEVEGERRRVPSPPPEPAHDTGSYWSEPAHESSPSPSDSLASYETQSAEAIPRSEPTADTASGPAAEGAVREARPAAKEAKRDWM